jgi:hypothetical protein
MKKKQRKDLWWQSFKNYLSHYVPASHPPPHQRLSAPYPPKIEKLSPYLCAFLQGILSLFTLFDAME